MYIRQDVLKPAGGSPGASAPKEPNITIVAIDDILTWPERDTKSVKMLGNFVMKENARMIQVYGTPSKSKASYESEGEEDTMTVKQKFEMEHPGDGLEIEEFIANWMGVNAIVIHGSCSDNFRKVVGTKCAPVQLKPTSQDDNDARKKMMVFEQYAKSKYVPGHYTGALSFDEPYEAATAAFAVNETNGSIYKLPSLAVTEAVTFTAMDLTAGQIVTLIGGGGAAPATLAQGVADAAEVILKAGTTWTALANSIIHFEVFDAGATKYLIEKSRQ